MSFSGYLKGVFDAFGGKNYDYGKKEMLEEKDKEIQRNKSESHKKNQQSFAVGKKQGEEQGKKQGEEQGKEQGKKEFDELLKDIFKNVRDTRCLADVLYVFLLFPLFLLLNKFPQFALQIQIAALLCSVIHEYIFRKKIKKDIDKLYEKRDVPEKSKIELKDFMSKPKAYGRSVWIMIAIAFMEKQLGVNGLFKTLFGS